MRALRGLERAFVSARMTPTSVRIGLRQEGGRFPAAVNELTLFVTQGASPWVTKSVTLLTVPGSGPALRALSKIHPAC
jgi:hypothetical protein